MKDWLFAPLKPMLLTAGAEPFDDDAYLFEPLWDGARLLLHKAGERVEAFTRRGDLVTARFPELRDIAASIRADRAILDCEGICLREGRANFDDFQHRLRISDPIKIAAAVRTHPATFIAFDCLYVESGPCADEPLMTRKDRLLELIAGGDRLQATLSITEQGRALHAATAEQGFEGTVAKRLDSPYRLGTRTPDWLTFKHPRFLDTVILGYRTEPHFALVVGAHFRTVPNKPIAIVSEGLSAEERDAFLAVAAQLHTTCDAKTQWLAPQLCCRIEYRDRTDMHQLGGTCFLRFLFDKDPADCTWSY